MAGGCREFERLGLLEKVIDYEFDLEMRTMQDGDRAFNLDAVVYAHGATSRSRARFDET